MCDYPNFSEQETIYDFICSNTYRCDYIIIIIMTILYVLNFVHPLKLY